MPPDPSFRDGNSDFSEFLADYFVECEEHLSAARKSLIALEPLLHRSTLDRTPLDDLFRAFHSLKGLSAMVGFQEAERLAHHLETFLSAVLKGQASLDLAGLECLMAGVVSLEQVIAARRDASAPPDISALLDRVSTLLPVSEQQAGSPASTIPLAGKMQSLGEKDLLIGQRLRSGAGAWRITFAPSAALVERGIDVNAIRKKLKELGEVMHSAPVIGEEGRVEFAFILVSEASEKAVLALQGEGLTCVPYQPGQAAESGGSHESTTEAARGGASTHLMPANIVRVDLARLDELMRLVGELVLTRARLDDGLRRLRSTAPAADVRVLLETTSAIERQLRDLREGVMRVRMVPIREVFTRMQFVVRDMTRESGKRVVLRFSGEETQIDKYVVERIMDPLLHLVRNAVSHGLEPPEERRAAGKAVEGRIDLRARTTGETVTIEVEDDGRGIDVERVLSQARQRGIASPETAADAANVLDVLCVPGFSTRERVDRDSGRGVGMDVVRKTAEELGGTLDFRTSLGQGTRFDIHLPLTLAITDALIVKVGDERYAVPQVAVREILRVEPGASTLLEKNELLRYREGVLPLLRLSNAFSSSAPGDDAIYVLVIGEGVQMVGIAVDRVLGLREIVVRPLTDRLVQAPGIAGATELGDGRVVLILDTADLSRTARKRAPALQP